MKKPNLKAVFTTARHFLKENDASLTSKTGLVLVLAGAGLGIYEAVKCTKKMLKEEPDICVCKACKEKVENTSKDIFNHVRNEHPDLDSTYVLKNPDIYFDKRYTFKKVGKTCWKHAIAPVVMMGAGSYAIIRSDNMMTNKIAALTAVQSVTDTYIRDYKEEVKDLIGEEKENEVSDNAMARDADRKWEEDLSPIDTGHGSELFYDYWGGRYFYSDPAFIRECVQDLDDILYSEDEACLNDLYEKINLPKNAPGEDYGWNTDSMKHLKFRPTSKIIGAGHSVAILGFSETPYRGWSHWKNGK